MLASFDARPQADFEEYASGEERLGRVHSEQEGEFAVEEGT